MPADWDSLSTNLLLVDDQGCDLSVGQLRRWLRHHIARVDWPAVVAAVLLPTGLTLH